MHAHNLKNNEHTVLLTETCYMYILVPNLFPHCPDGNTGPVILLSWVATIAGGRSKWTNNIGRKV